MENTSVDLNRIQLFKLVVDLGSFSKAAERLGVPKSNVSRNITNLESQLRTQLIYRTTRQFQPTEAGKQLYAGSREALMRLEETVKRITSVREEICGQIRMTAPEDLGLIMMPLIAEFLKAHPKVQIDCHLTNAILKLVQDGIDLSVRAGTISDASLLMRKLGTAKLGLVASESFAKRFEKLLTIETLNEVPCVTFRPLGDSNFWEMHSSSKKRKIKIKPICVIDSTAAAREAAMLGMGVVPIPLVICRKELVSGELVRVLPDWQFREVPFQILMPPQKEKRAVVAAFADHITSFFKEQFIWI